MNNGLDMKQFDGKNALVTGGAGAIGSQLVRELVSAGASVTVLDDFSSGRMENLRDLSGMVTVIRGSVSSAEPLRAAFSKSPHYVFHLAAHFANQNSVEHPYADMMTNCVGTQMVLDEARKVPNLEGLVYASSSCVVAGQTGKTHDDMRPLPETPY
jgi:nucleoside-diphosphate-sugar epimerase